MKAGITPNMMLVILGKLTHHQEKCTISFITNVPFDVLGQSLGGKEEESRYVISIQCD